MKKIAILALGLLAASALTVSAAEKKPLSPEAEKVKKELLEKYDADKNGKLDEAEIAKISEDDKKKAKDAGLPLGGKKKKDK